MASSVSSPIARKRSEETNSCSVGETRLKPRMRDGVPALAGPRPPRRAVVLGGGGERDVELGRHGRHLRLREHRVEMEVARLGQEVPDLVLRIVDTEHALEIERRTVGPTQLDRSGLVHRPPVDRRPSAGSQATNCSLVPRRAADPAGHDQPERRGDVLEELRAGGGIELHHWPLVTVTVVEHEAPVPNDQVGDGTVDVEPERRQPQLVDATAREPAGLDETVGEITEQAICVHHLHAAGEASSAVDRRHRRLLVDLGAQPAVMVRAAAPTRGRR